MKTVLVIDDDEIFRAGMTSALALAGWRVLEASDGEAGLQEALLNRPDAILCDLLMPRCNGFQFCRALRNHADRVGRPRIIVTTGSGYATDRKSALEAGADDYLVKPVRSQDLIDLLARTVGAPSGATGEQPARVESAPEPMKLHFWGVRGSIATPGPSTLQIGGNTACIEVRAEGEIISFDAGTGIRPMGMALMQEFGERPIHLTILVSHTHWDHIQGFPFFVPAYNPRNRIRILGYEGARRGLEITLSAQMESPYFPVSLQQMPGHIGIQELRDFKFNIGRVAVQAAFLNHPGICTGYRLTSAAGSIAYLPDIEPYHRFLASREYGADAEATMGYARSQEDRLIEFLRGADVLVIDSQYDADEYERHVGWGHSSIDDSVTLALKAGVKRMFTFHHDPTHDDAKVLKMAEHGQALVRAQGGSLVVEAAREGVEVVLSPKADGGT